MFYVLGYFHFCGALVLWFVYSYVYVMSLVLWNLISASSYKLNFISKYVTLPCGSSRGMWNWIIVMNAHTLALQMFRMDITYINAFAITTSHWIRAAAYGTYREHFSFVHAPCLLFPSNCYPSAQEHPRFTVLINRSGLLLPTWWPLVGTPQSPDTIHQTASLVPRIKALITRFVSQFFWCAKLPFLRWWCSNVQYFSLLFRIVCNHACVFTPLLW
jgi:hypothetical protein